VRIGFRQVEEFPGWTQAGEFLEQLIRRSAASDVLEVGAGANPVLSAEQVRRLGVSFVINDTDPGELDKAGPGYDRLVADFCDPVPPPAVGRSGPYDLVFSRMVHEHLTDARTFYANIFRLLRPGGLSAHCFSTLYALPMLVNRLVPDWLSDRLLEVFAPRDREKKDKFPAHYDWGRGPTPRMMARFRSLGYEVVEYVGYFGHTYYARRLPRLDALEKRKARLLTRHPIPYLTAYAHVVLRKPGNRG
jgi:SAM-dependent methyltransferase